MPGLWVDSGFLFFNSFTIFIGFENECGGLSVGVIIFSVGNEPQLPIVLEAVSQVVKRKG